VSARAIRYDASGTSVRGVVLSNRDERP